MGSLWWDRAVHLLEDREIEEGNGNKCIAFVTHTSDFFIQILLPVVSTKSYPATTTLWMMVYSAKETRILLNLSTPAFEPGNPWRQGISYWEDISNPNYTLVAP